MRREIIETGARLNSLEEASTKTNISKSGISQALSGRYKTAGGFKWRKV